MNLSRWFKSASPLHWGNHLQAWCALDRLVMKDFTAKRNSATALKKCMSLIVNFSKLISTNFYFSFWNLNKLTFKGINGFYFYDIISYYCKPWYLVDTWVWVDNPDLFLFYMRCYHKIPSICFCFLNQRTPPSKAILPLRRKGLLVVKENEITLEGIGNPILNRK